MIRFLLLAAGLAAGSPVFSQTVKLVNAREVVEKGKVLYDSGKYSQAIEEYLTVPKRDTGYIFMLTELAPAYNANEEFDKAIAVCEEGLSKPSEYRAHLLRTQAIATDRKGDYEKSTQLFNKAIESYPFDYSLIFNLGITYYNSKEYDKATEYFFRTLAINPFHAGSHLNLALLSAAQGKRTHAMLSFGLYLSVANSDNGRLIILEQVLSNQFKEDGTIPYDGANAFEKLDQIIRAKIAMEANYKTTIDFNVATVRQFQMFFEQFATIDKDANDPWNRYYVSIYDALKQNDLIDAFVCHIVNSANNEQVKKWQKKNEKKISTFYDVMNAAIRKKRETLSASALGYPHPTSAWYNDDDSKLEALGNKTAQGENDGKWIFYKSNSEKAAEGNFKAGKKVGTWTYYEDDGSVSSVENYDTGEMRIYNEGAVNQHFFLKETKIHGEVELYSTCGILSEKLIYNNGKRQGPGKLYFSSGKLKQTYNYENDLISGEQVNFYENGKTESRVGYKENKLHGPYLEYYPNGKLKAKGDYKDGAIVGEWKYFHGNGKLEKTGSYTNGLAVGEWMYYDVRGNQIEKRIFTAGKFDGDNTFYHEGKVYYINTYKEDLLIKATYFDETGKVIASAGNTNGTFNAKTYFPSGQLAGEGQFKNGKVEGPWKYYFPEGSKRSEFVFVNGDTEGKAIEYHRSGSKKYDSHYKGGPLDGYFTEYYEHGQIKQEGWFANGKREQQWLSYYPDGVLETDYYYQNDELHGESYDYDTRGKLVFLGEYKDGLVLRLNDFDDKETDIMTMSKKENEVLYETNYSKGKPRSRFKAQCGRYTSVVKWFPNGQPFYSYDLLDGKKNGLYNQYTIGGQLAKQGLFIGGNEEGLWNSHYENGKLNWKGMYLQGENDSTWVYYYENGEIASTAEFMQDERHGITTIYSPDGKPLFEKRYYMGYLLSYRTVANGKRGDWILFDGNTTIVINYSDGKLAFEEAYKNGVIEGLTKINYSNGNPCSEYRSERGGYQGDFKTYYVTGKVREQGSYKLGELHGLLEKFNEDGSLASRENYIMGSRQGKAELFVRGSKTVEYNFYGGMTYE